MPPPPFIPAPLVPSAELHSRSTPALLWFSGRNSVWHPISKETRSCFNFEKYSRNDSHNGATLTNGPAIMTNEMENMTNKIKIVTKETANMVNEPAFLINKTISLVNQSISLVKETIFLVKETISLVIK